MLKNIVLIGPSGIGKSTIGKYISNEMNNFRNIDTDELIERKTKMSIQDIFNSYGEPYFRHIEKSIVKSIQYEKNCVIATGGGIIKDTENIRYLKKNGVLFLLYGSKETIIRNLNNSTNTRPLIDNSVDMEKAVEKLLLEREKLYFNYTDFVIYVDNKNVKQISNEIIDMYEKIFAL